MNEKPILAAKLPGKGGIGLITLNRPEALNALNKEMCQIMLEVINEWNNDPDVKAIVVRGAGDRAFCAGGDVRSIYDIRHEELSKKQSFFRYEYRLDHAFFHCKKPCIAFLDGITMGGGVGISWPAMFRIATEKLKFAMPETTIGLYPDVGAGYFLSRSDLIYSRYLALTGAHVTGADAGVVNFATHCVASKSLDEILKRLCETAFEPNDPKRIADVINVYQDCPKSSQLASQYDLLKECFKYDTVEKIIAALESSADEAMHKIAETLKTKSPISLKVTLEQLKRYSKRTYDECLEMDFRVTTHFLEGNDFFEGVRALLIDKDKNPKWQPNDLSQVTDSMVASYFASVEDKLEF